MPLPVARLNTSAEVWRELTEVGIFRDPATPVATTLDEDGGVEAGDATITVDDASGLAEGDFIRIGSGENLEVRAITDVTGEVLTLDLVLLQDHDDGVAVAKQEKRNIGHVAEGGMQVNVTPEFFEILAATHEGPLVRRLVSAPQEVQFPLLNLSMANLALAMGQDEETMVAGSSGTFRVGWVPGTLARLQNISVYAEGLREDLTVLEMRGHSFSVDINKSMTFARNAATELGFAGRADGGLEWIQTAAE